MFVKATVFLGLALCVALAVRIPTHHHQQVVEQAYYKPVRAPVAYAQPQYEEIHYDHGPIIVRRRDREEKKKLEEEQGQNFENIPGVPGHDYPIYHSVPHTSFSCHNVPAVPGMYANPETGCQAYHVCHDGREGDQGSSFLCTNGTLFNQASFACDWWYNVDCHQSQSLWRLNADPELNPYTPKKKLVDGHDLI